MAFKICKQILDQSKTRNPLKDWSGAIFEEPISSAEKFQIVKLKQAMNRHIET